MRSYRLSTAIILTALFLVPLLAAAQGLTWETTMTLPMGGEQTMNSTSMYLPHMFKQVSEGTAAIFRLDKKLLIRVDYNAKEYSQVTFTELEALVKEANGAMASQMAELKKHMEGMPPEQRKMMEQMMGGKGMPGAEGGGKLAVTKGGTKTINGYPCTNYVVKEGDQEVASIWTTMKVPEFAAMQGDLKEFGERMASQMTMRGPQMAQAMSSVEGFPIQTSIGGMTATVSKIAKSAVAPSEFEVPAGFTKVPFDLGGKDRHGRPDDEQQEE